MKRTFATCIEVTAVTFTLALGLAGCGGQATNAAQQDSPAGATAAEASYSYARVDYEGWTLDFGEAKVVWSERDKTDVVVIPMKATNNKDSESEFANLDNLLAFPEDSDSHLSFAYNSDYLDLDAEDEQTKPGASIELCYAWELDGNYGTIRVAVQGYTVSEDDTEVKFTGIGQTKAAARFEETAAAELEAKQNANEAKIKGATMAKPDGWYFDAVDDISLTVRPDDESSYATVDVSFATVSETPAERATKYAGNYGLDTSVVQTATINGVEWSYFIPTETQFQAFAQADGGIIKADGMSIGWDEATPVMESIAIG